MTTANDEKAAAKEQLKARSAAMEKKEKELNSGKTGKGLRKFVSMTRGKNPQEVTWEGFDETQPLTLPANYLEFMNLSGLDTKTTTEQEILVLEYLITGYNDAMYSQASDPIAEFVEPSWPDDIKTRFRASVRNYARDAEVSIEDAVEIIKPGIVKSQAKKQQELTTA